MKANLKGLSKRLKRKKPRNGFKRSSKEWEESVSGHIGRIVDATKVKDFIDLFAYAGVAVLGWQATQDPRGALTGVVGLKLATTQGGTPPAAQIAGLGILGFLGVLALKSEGVAEKLKDVVALGPFVDAPIVAPESLGVEVDEKTGYPKPYWEQPFWRHITGQGN